MLTLIAHFYKSYIATRDETYYNISIYCNTFYSNTMQYGLKEILIYCNIAILVVNYTTKMTVPLITWIYASVSYAFIWLVMQGVILFFAAKTHIPI